MLSCSPFEKYNIRHISSGWVSLLCVKGEVRRKMNFTYVLGFVVLRGVVKVFPVSSSSFVRKKTGRNRARSHSGMTRPQDEMGSQIGEVQWQIGYGVGLRIKRSSVRIRPWPLRWVLGQGSLLPLSQGEAFTLASISYMAILVKYILGKKKFVSSESDISYPILVYLSRNDNSHMSRDGFYGIDQSATSA